MDGEDPARRAVEAARAARPRTIAGDQLSRLVAGLERDLHDAGAGVDRAYLAKITDDQPLVSGSGAPAIILRGRVAESGLWLPESVDVDPGPADAVLVYLTAEEILGESIAFDEVLQLISQASLAEALVFASEWLALLHGPSANRHDVDRQFVHRMLPEALHVKMMNLLADPVRALITEQSLLVLIKLAARFSPDLPRSVDELRVGHLVLALLGISDHLGADDLEGSPGQARVSALDRELLRNQAFNSRQAEAALLAGFVRRWLELPGERAEDPQVVDLEDTYERAAGPTLRDINSMAMLLWSGAISHGPVITSEYTGAVSWSQDRLDAALKPFVIDLAQAREQIQRETEEYGLDWANNTFTHRPVVRLPSGALIVVDPYLALRRGFGRILLEDINAGALPPAERSRARGCVDHLTEVFALECLAAVVGTGPHGRLYDETALRRAYGKNLSTADAAIDYGAAWVVCEVTTTPLLRTTIGGSGDAGIREDMERYVRKMRQLHETIGRIRVNEERLTGEKRGVGVTPFRPILILEDGFPVNPATLGMLREAAAAERLLVEPDVAPLHVIDLDELGMIEGLQAEHGPGLLALLEGQARSNMRAMALRNYILNTLRLNPRRPARQMELVRVSFDRSIGTLDDSTA
jgi:hypothetical protein